MSKDSVCARVPWQDTRRARVDQGLHACHVLVLDDTHLLAEQRKKVWRIAVRHGAAFLQVFVDSSAMELRQLVARSVDAAQQSHGRKVLVPSDVIQKTIQLAEPPDPSLRAWESDSVTILAADTTSCDRVIEMIIDRVRSSFQQQQQQQQQSQVTIQQGGTPACASRTAHPERDSEAPTVRHAVDLTMRRIISNLIAEASCAAERAVLAGILAERKQRMLSELRSGEINVDDLSEMRIRAYLESARTPAEQAPLYRN
ncbi:hypothetical protein FVE85_3033 [Porphyridium purpureum]|uniref:Uncharacterized protein n=1 Tax=Porphyridium purpureum TaxID=35688 RepID=A0A5J4YVA6_PORPP|nr:hypothetical protein FVE85_3033 [Porphyridium purpureum]|eukprot:POR8048..scf227_4